MLWGQPFFCLEQHGPLPASQGKTGMPVQGREAVHNRTVLAPRTFNSRHRWSTGSRICGGLGVFSKACNTLREAFR